MLERTFAIVKPDAVAKGAAGEILRRAQASGLRIVGLKMLHLTKADAGRFYVVHKERPFYDSLTTFMSEGPIVMAAFEGQGAIAKWRELMGPTDSKKAPQGTIRGDFGTDVERNAAHGSDAPETAQWEIAFFFSQHDLIP